MPNQTLTTLNAALPPPWPHPLDAAFGEVRAALGGDSKVVVLDDDPTGTQSVHGIPVLSEWRVESLVRELRSACPAFYILTNSRSVGTGEARALSRDVGSALREAGKRSHTRFTLVSRGDSTLRGHYPAETDALAETFGGFDATFLIPAFFEGGRYTAADVHYVLEGDTLIPAAETPFAQDASFGYRHSNLRAWVEEKTAGRRRASEVASLSLDLIRSSGPEGVLRQALSLPANAVCVVNALCERDLEVATLALMKAEATGKKFLYRTAASFVPLRAGIPEKPLLTKRDFGARERADGLSGGLVIIGSYVPKSSAQLAYLTQHSDVATIELRVENLLDEERREFELERVQRALNERLREGDAVLYTSRGLVTGNVTGREGEGSLDVHLDVNRRVSASLVAVVRGLEGAPRFIIAKGGITSSDVATKALGMKRAQVLGRLLPGVPVWELGPETPYPSLPYVVFPGNVGGEAALFEAYRKVSE